MISYRAMNYSAKRGIAIACRPSACQSVMLVDQDHIGWKSWKLTARTISVTSSLFVAPKGHPPTPRRTRGNFGETRGVVRKSGVLEQKSGNICETRKDIDRLTDCSGEDCKAVWYLWNHNANLHVGYIQRG